MINYITYVYNDSDICSSEHCVSTNTHINWNMLLHTKQQILIQDLFNFPLIIHFNPLSF